MYVPDEPPVGHLIAYEYLWLSQSTRRDDGVKTYPCAIVMASRIETRLIAYALAVSHKAPEMHERTMAVPPKLKRWLGLDDERAWIYTDQANVFAWPGPDLRPADRLSRLPAARDTCVIGRLPDDWFASVVQHLLASHATMRVRALKR